MKEIIVSSKEELLSKVNQLKEDNVIKYEVSLEDIKFNIVIEVARCKFFGNMMMTLTDTVCLYIDDGDKFFKRCFVNTAMLSDYLDLITGVTKERELFCAYLLTKSQLYPGDKVLIKRAGAKDKMGVINKPTDRFVGQISYSLIKKDGMVGSREYLLYGESDSFSYKCLNRDYIDYNKLM